MMKNDRQTISPSEINKFVYCPYQWYYERKFGSAELRRQASNRAGANNSDKSNFIRGARYHSSFLRRYKFKRMLFLFVAIAVISLLFFIALKYGG